MEARSGLARCRRYALLGLRGVEGTHIIESREFRIGRNMGCDLRVDSDELAEEHASLLVTKDQVIAVDLNSRSGTYLDGEPITIRAIEPGQNLVLGSGVTLRLIIVSDRGFDRDRKPPMSPREKQVAVLVAQGLTNACIAHQLGIRPRTVATHLEHIYAKLAIGRRGQLIRWVIDRPGS